MSATKAAFLALTYPTLYPNDELVRQYREAGVASEVLASLALTPETNANASRELAPDICNDEEQV